MPTEAVFSNLDEHRPVAVLLYPGCVFQEIALAVEVLAPHRPLHYLTPDGAVHRASNGARLQADGDYGWLGTEAVAQTAPYWAGLRFERANLVVDAEHRRITAQPWADRDLAAALAQALGVLDPAAAEALRTDPLRRRYP